jgi:hypothetical protein
VFVRKVRPDVVDALTQHDAYAPLVRSVVGPASAETLVVRMIGFLFQYCPIVQDLAGEGAGSEARYIGFFARSGVDVWQAVCDAADAAERAPR